MARVRCRGAGVKPTKGLTVAIDICDSSVTLFLPLDWLDGSGEVDSSSSSSIVACAVRGGRGVGCANRGRAVELMTSMRNERRREYGVAKSLSSVPLCSDVTAGVEGRSGAKKRGRGRGGKAGVGVNITDAGDDCATETVGRDSVSSRFDEAGVAAGEWGWGVGSSEEKVGPGSSSVSAALLV